MPTYQFDPLCRLPENIVSQDFSVGTVSPTEVAYFVFDAAPVFLKDMAIIDKATSQPLVRGRDYVPIYEYKNASTVIEEPLFGGFAFTNPGRSGQYVAQVHTVGGDFVNPLNASIQDGLGILSNLQNIDWSNIANTPATFPPTPYTARLDRLSGHADFLQKIDSLRVALEQQYKHIKISDIQDLDGNFLTPALTHLAGISNVLRQMNAINTLDHHHATNAGTPVTQTNVAANTWTQALDPITITHGGLFSVAVDFRSKPTWVSGTNDVDKEIISRIRLGASVGANASVKQGIIHIPDGETITLEFKAPRASLDSIVLSDSDMSCSLVLIRLARGV